VKAPRTIRVLLDRHGHPIESHDASKCTQAYARERRRELAKLHPEDAPFAVGTYELRPPGGKRAVITLTPKKKQ
jgi:hypothetical protein